MLFPLLPHHLAVQIAEAACSASIQSLADGAAVEHTACEYTPSGGSRVSKAALRTLRGDLMRVAVAAGYPNVPNQQQAAAFDAEAAVVLAHQIPLAPVEAAKSGPWEFMTCVLLPDLVRWRFSGTAGSTSMERFVSGRRNAYQRLWWRAFHLSPRLRAGSRLGQLLQTLGEDELVQLMERPSLAGIEGLPAAIAEGFLRASAQYSDLTRRQLIREAQKRFLRLSSFLSLESIAPEEVDRHVKDTFDQVAASLLRV